MHKENVEFIEQHLLCTYTKIGIDKPSNHDAIVEFCVDDIGHAADTNFTSEDINIAFRRFIQSISEE